MDELHKLFSLSDRDGSGRLSVGELSGLLASVAGTQPSQAEVDAFIRLLDKDQDGQVDFNEFSSALSAWLAEDLGHSSSPSSSSSPPGAQSMAIVGGSMSPLSESRKRKDCAVASDRSLLHKRIRQFFLQFRPRPNFADLRQRLARQAAASNANNGDHTQAQDMLIEDPLYRPYTPAERLECLDRVSLLLGSLGSIASSIMANSPADALQGCAALAEILTICEAYRTPDDRYEIAELLVSVFERVSEAAVLRRVIEFLPCHELPMLQFHALHVLANYCNGPRILHTPAESILHPSNMLHKSRCIQLGAAHALVSVLASTTHEVIKEQVIYCLGCLASYDAEARDLLLDLGVYSAAYGGLTDGLSLSMTAKIVWLLSIFCGLTHANSRPVKYEAVSGALPKLAYLLARGPDERVLLYTFSCLSFLLPGNEIEPDIGQAIVNYTGHASALVQEAALKCVRSLLSVDAAAGRVFVDSSLMLALRELLKSASAATRSLALECLQLLLEQDEPYFISAFIDSDLLASLAPLLATDDEARPRIALILKKAIGGSAAHINYFFGQHDIVQLLSANLHHFKVYDALLKENYSFLGASFNFEYLSDLLFGLAFLLDRLISEAEPSPALADKFGLGCLDRLKDILLLMYGDAADLMDAWRNGEANRTVKPLEEQIKEIIMKIRLIHEKARTQTSQAIAASVSQILDNAESQRRMNSNIVDKKRREKQRAESAAAVGPRAAAPSSVPSITVKCFFNGDNRVLDFSSSHLSSMSLRELANAIALKYDRALTIQYEDSEGDKITIDSQELLNKALATVDQASKSLRLYLIPKQQQHSADDAQPFRGARPNNKVAQIFAHHAGSVNSTDTAAFFARLGSNNNRYNGHANAHESAPFHHNAPHHPASAPPHSHPHPHPPSRHWMRDLVDVTRFSRHDLENLYAQFQRSATHGRLNQQQFADGLKGIQEDPQAIEQLFRAFDYDNKGSISFQEFAIGLSTLHRGSMDERLRLAFHAFDTDGNGRLDRRELFMIYKSALIAKGLYSDDAAVQQLVEKTFTEVDGDRDGLLDFDEFKKAAIMHPIMVETFWSTGK